MVQETALQTEQKAWWNRLPVGVTVGMKKVWGSMTQAMAAPLESSLHLSSGPSVVHLFCPPDAEAPPRVWDGLWYEPEHPVFQSLTSEPALDAASSRPLLLDGDSLTFALQQFYPCQAVTISGWGEPLRNPHWQDWLAACETYTKPVTQLYSHADWEPNDVRRLWEQPLDRLTVQLVAHTPSAALSMAQPTSLFTASKPLRLDWRTWQRRVLAVEALMASRPKKTRVFVEVALLVDAVTVFHIPEMIVWAKNLGVDGVRLENRFTLGSGLDPLTLTTHPSEALTALREMMATDWPLHVEWPTLWEASPDVLGSGCQLLNTTVSMAQDLSVSPCPKRLVATADKVSVWEQKLWEHEGLMTLRQAHSAGAAASELPWACHSCRHRCEVSA
jgi:hypothetical protein